MKNYILLALAIVAGVMAFFIAKKQLEKRYHELDLAGRKVKVLVPNKDLAKGMIIQKSDLSLRRMLASYTTGEELTNDDFRLIVGQKLNGTVKRGDPFRWRDFELPDIIGSGSMLARAIPIDERAMSIAVDSTSSVSGMIRPNDHVDIVGTFRFPTAEPNSALDTVTLTILQNVTVLAVGQEISSNSADRNAVRTGSSYSTMTLSVTPAEAEMLIFSQQKGKLSFTLRSPRDVKSLDRIQEVNFDFLKDNLSSYSKDRQDRIKEQSGMIR